MKRCGVSRGIRLAISTGSRADGDGGGGRTLYIARAVCVLSDDGGGFAALRSPPPFISGVAAGTMAVVGREVIR